MSAALLRPAGTITGYVEAVTETAALGWVWSAGRSERLAVELRLDGQAVARAVADQMREDLARSGIGDGCHAFVLPIPDAARPRGAELTIVALSEGAEHTLATPPVTALAAPAASSSLARLERGIDVLIDSQRLMHRNLQSALLGGASSAPTTLADVAAAQASLQESIATFELFAIRLEQALAEQQRPAPPTPSRRGFALIVGLSAAALAVSCCALARVMLLG